MTKPRPEYALRPYFKCLCCTHEWRPLRPNRPPLACPRCRRTDWDTGPGTKTATGLRRIPVAIEVAPEPAPDPYLRLREDVRGEYAAFLERRAAQDAQNRAEHAERAGQRRYELHEIENADVRPPMMQDGTPFRLAKLTLTRRSQRKKT